MTTEEKVIQWAFEKGLLTNGNVHAQLCKVVEELGELSSAILKNKDEEIIDALGDVQVTLIILSTMLGKDYSKCLDEAYAVIAKRSGKMVNGSFIKDE
jgi:NTP pyrophosphatase (non-canonical NTP hydrolase)